MKIENNKLIIEISDEEKAKIENLVKKNINLDKELISTINYLYRVNNRKPVESNIDKTLEKLNRYASLKDSKYHLLMRSYILNRDLTTLKAKRSDVISSFYELVEKEYDNNTFNNTLRFLIQDNILNLDLSDDSITINLKYKEELEKLIEKYLKLDENKYLNFTFKEFKK